MEMIIRNERTLEWVKNTKHREVYLKHLVTSKDNDRLSAHIVRIEKGGEIVPHTHEIMEVFYFMKGQGLALVNGERIKVDAGSVIIAPAGTQHGLINDGDEELILFSVFSPANV